MLTPHPDPETTLDKFNVARSGCHDIESEVPRSVRTRRTLTQAAVRKDGKKVTVPVDVHNPGDEDTSCDDDDEEPGLPDSDSSDGRTLWYFSEDTRKGTAVTILHFIYKGNKSSK